MSVRRPLLAAALVVAAGAATLTLPGVAGADPGKHDRAASRGTVAEIRQAIATYRDVDAAVADGFVPVSGCEQSPAGAMGIHYMKFANIGVGEVDPLKPVVLLYGPATDGGLRLLGAEYFQPNVGQERPTLAGEPFDGPMPGHNPQMPEHYDLHVWTEVANPAGVFAPWNPAVRC